MSIFINGSFIGASFPVLSVPIFAKIPYNKLTIFGAGIFDKIWVRNMGEDTAYYDAINTVFQYQPTFDNNTVFLADFSNNLSAGNISSGGEDIDSWIITKRKIGESINKLVGEFSFDTSTAYDFRTQVNENYIYQITPKTANTLGQPLVTNVEASSYNGLFLIDEETGLSIDFSANGEIGAINARDDQTIHRTLNKHDTISIGDKNTLSGTISGIVNSNLRYCDGIIQSPEFIDTVQDFVNNKSSKLLKTKKGDIYKIVTWGFSKTVFVNAVKEPLDVISFSWQEIEDVTDY